MRFVRTLLFACSLMAVAGCPLGVLPPGPTPDDRAIKAAVLKWNKTAYDTSGLDHKAVQEGEDRLANHQLGPGRSARAMAITHIAIFDAVNAVVGGYESYTRIPAVSAELSVEAAIAQAGYDTLVSLYPSHAPRLNIILQADLDAIADGQAKDNGIALGGEAAAAILALREGDGSEIPDVYEFSDLPGYWRADPLNPTQKPLDPEWYRVAPFVMNSATQFRVPPPPTLDSSEYTAAYNEAKSIGGDGIVTPTIRTEEQTQIGIYWAYDGTPSLCAPPRMYNQITSQLAQERETSGVETARLFALVNVAMADAGIAIWESKYFYEYWRPVAAIREADEGMGPTGIGDGNPDTVADPAFVPMCAPASNLAGPNFTPPFPAYPSGHAGFGGALFETLRNFYGTNDIAFTFVSDEWNGETVDNAGEVRPLIPRTFTSLSQAEAENGQSRIYLGIHWQFDITEGIAQGRNVGDHVFNNAFQPVP